MSEVKNKELQVAAIENGTVIDHIPSDKLFKVTSLLGLDKLEHQLTIGNNFPSNKMGSKGVIKIANKFFEEDEISRIALIVGGLLMVIPGTVTDLVGLAVLVVVLVLQRIENKKDKAAASV